MSFNFDTQSYNIVLNESNLEQGDTSKSRYIFPFAGTKRFDRAKVALSSVSLFYSWASFGPQFNNQNFSFIFTDGGGATTYNITVTAGFYTVSQLNSFFQAFCITNGLYLVDGSGNYVYYGEITDNSSQYAIQLNCYPFPTALPAGWTNPAGLTFPAIATTPQFVINNDGFSTWTGISPGTYPNPAQSTTYSKISDFTPKTTPVEQVIMRCNLVNNRISNPPDVIYTFNASGTSFGGLITSSPNEYLYLDIQSGYYSQIQISFVDQNYRAIQIQDASIIVQLSFIESLGPPPRAPRPL